MKLDTAANLVTILTGVAVLATLVGRLRAPQPPVPQPPCAINDDLRPLGINFDVSKTVILVLQTNCPYCNPSMPFYITLLNERNQRPSNARIIVLADATDADIDAHLTTAGLHPDAVTHVEGLWTHIPGTPTILVADNRGKLVKMWTAQLAPEDEKEVKQYVFSN